jgi:RimJ/RimL family protein N-acetyltransferase
MDSRLEPVIETSRLVLRRPLLEDLDRWAEMMANADAARFVGGVAPKPIVWRMIMQVRGAWDVTGIAMFSVIEKATNRWVGRVGPWQPYDWPGTEVGWGLHPDAWGKGYALEAAAASMDYAFDTLGWSTVIHCINPDNSASQAVARRLGSSVLGPGRMPPPLDHETVDLWGQRREDWTRNRRQVLASLVR